MARRVRLLAATFFGRLFDHELFSSPVSASSGLTWILAGLATPGVMVSVSQLYFYAHARTFAPERQDRILFVSQAFHVDFAMAVAGVLTMLVWTSLTPDRRDALVLGPLPVRPFEQALARMMALGGFFVLMASALALPTAVVFTFVTVGAASPADVLGRIVGHAAAVGAAAAFVFLLLLDLQLVLAATVGPRVVRAATVPLQMLALAGMVAAVASTGRLSDALMGADTAGHTALLWNPAAWFVGLYRSLAGDTRAVFSVLAARGVVATAVALLVAVVAYPLAFERCLCLAIVGDHHRQLAWTRIPLQLWLRVLHIVLRSPLERGLATFMATALTRSHSHRFVAGSFAGVGLLSALPLASRLMHPATSSADYYAWFSVPLGVLCWWASGLRVAMMLPLEPRANWVFRLSEPVDKRRVLNAVVATLQCTTVGPMALVSGVGATVAGGPWLGALVTGVVAAAGLALTEVLTLSLRGVPFACTYRPGQLRLRVLWPVYLLTWLLVAYQLPSVIARRVDEPHRAVMVLAVLASLWLGLRAWRRVRARVLRAFVFDEVEPVATTIVQLGPSGA